MPGTTRVKSLGLQRTATLCGAVLVVAALAIIWAGRISQGRDMYVSELGARGEPTAKWFQFALLLIVAGGSLIAHAGRGIRCRLRILRTWTPAISIWIGCGFFLIASQVPCTTGCPLPVGPTFSWQDLVHTSVAVLAFAAACIGMLQVAFAVAEPRLAWFSLAAALSVAVVAGAGGMLSLLRFQANIGSRFELLATTLALGWLLTLGVILFRRMMRPPAVLPVAVVLPRVDFPLA